MTTRAFDAITRRAARVRDRRTFLGVVAGMFLVIAQQPLPTLGKKDSHHNDSGGHHGGGSGNNGGGNNKKKEKKCKKQATACLASVGAYCLQRYYYDVVVQQLCLFEYQRCCGLYRDCKPANANICIQEGVF
jgi:hypothetical protein